MRNQNYGSEKTFEEEGDALSKFVRKQSIDRCDRRMTEILCYSADKIEAAQRNPTSSRYHTTQYLAQRSCFRKKKKYNQLWTSSLRNTRTERRYAYVCDIIKFFRTQLFASSRYKHSSVIQLTIQMANRFFESHISHFY